MGNAEMLAAELSAAEDEENLAANLGEGCLV
jgi:hypothetical protein